MNNWIDTSSHEIYLLLSFMILQGISILYLGIHNMPADKNYFSQNPLLSTPIFSKLFTESRYILLMKFLHFNDNSRINEYSGEDKLLFKISPIINYIRAKIKEIYTPQREICVDESLLLWKGRLKYKVYMPLKSSRFGIKYYELCESRTGYIWNFFVYVGKDTKFADEIADKPFSFKVVVQLSRDLLNKGYFITMDNFFTSVGLFQFLTENNTDCLGTARINRIGIPDKIKKTKLEKNNHLIMYKGILFTMI